MIRETDANLRINRAEKKRQEFRRTEKSHKKKKKKRVHNGIEKIQKGGKRAHVQSKFWMKDTKKRRGIISRRRKKKTGNRKKNKRRWERERSRGVSSVPADVDVKES